MNELWENEGEDVPRDAALSEKNPLEWDADSTEGADVPCQPLPDYESTFFQVVPGVEVIDAQ